MIAYIDMDDVLVDFTGGFLELLGWTPQRYLKSVKREVWPLYETTGQTADEFWAMIRSGGERFWETLLPTEHCYQVITLVQQYFDEWYLLTTPGIGHDGFRCLDSYTGKLKWIRNQFGIKFDNYVLTPHKHLVAHNSLLIDDNPENVTSFRRNGGAAIVFPLIRNLYADKANQPVSYLRTQLRVLLN